LSQTSSILLPTSAKPRTLGLGGIGISFKTVVGVGEGVDDGVGVDVLFCTTPEEGELRVTVRSPDLRPVTSTLILEPTSRSVRTYCFPVCPLIFWLPRYQV
jgi:hypothetical protein